MEHVFRHAPAVIVGAFFLFIGAQKFGAENVIFQTIADRSGLAFFEPQIRGMVGVAEIAAGAAILTPAARLLGLAIGGAVLLGAIGFHLSPWLGVVVAAAPGEEATPALFVVAVLMTTLTGLVAWLERARISTLLKAIKPRRAAA